MRKHPLFLAGLAAIAATSCTDEIYEAPRDEDYSKTFVEMFGQIDPNQDWNMAERRTVTVNAGSGSDVYVYASSANGYRLAAHYAGVSGVKELAFDGVEGYEEFIVTDGRRSVVARSGQSVDLSGTRGYSPDVKDVFTARTDYTNFKGEAVREFLKMVPDEQDNTNKKGLFSNYIATAKSRKTNVYPIYWCTQSTIEFGVYVMDERNNPVRYPIFSNSDVNTTGDIKYTLAKGNNPENFKDSDWKKMLNPSSTSTEPTGFKLDNVTYFSSKGATLNFEEGTVYGFYIHAIYPDSKGDEYVYTDADLNGGKNLASYTTVTLEDGTERTFIGFEDWPAEANNKIDLNDFVVILDPAPEVLDLTPHEYLFACEDLGSGDDFDFNDVVFSLSYVSGRREAKIKALAAGGTLPVQLYYDGKEIGPEFHKWFGDDVTSDKIVNTDRNGFTAKGGEQTFMVKDGFSISGIGAETEISGGGLQGLSLTVSGTKRITPPGAGKAPQMIIVDKNWRWPAERQSIISAYPGFESWIKDFSNTNWVNTAVEDFIY